MSLKTWLHPRRIEASSVPLFRTAVTKPNCNLALVGAGPARQRSDEGLTPTHLHPIVTTGPV